MSPESTRTAIVTGGSRGIGLATAHRLAAAGYAVVITARHADQLEIAAERIRGAGGRCAIAAVDLTESGAAGAVLSVAHDEFGGVDVLVNNAGAAPLVNVAEMEAEAFEQAMRLNCGAVFDMTRAVWSDMQQRGGGVIVNISSRASIDPFPGFAVYGASKAWVNLFTRALAGEGAPHDIRVYAVAPGAVESDLLRANFPGIPPDQCLAPDDVAAMIELLCDSRARHASGETVHVVKK